ncbi:insulin-like growth factor-binding protein 4 isoform X1 [Penaeus monodon]|uniref:insulin-like growth factor-binding protein 4 isoform X1 n=2 Tax=Penaeus monodon TaxID=6687 RepID=UPI0018A707D9|nr:insulin-like growth factor-binding protein 4 isoform X1 [Penaeus monodon]
MKPLLVLVASLAVIHVCSGLSCMPCAEVKCKRPSGCAFGTVRDVCGCCYQCAKGPGQPCGGMWLLNGRCGDGLKCQPAEGQPMFDFPEEYLDGECVSLAPPKPASLTQLNPLAGMQGQAGGPGASGLVGSKRIGKTKKLAKQHSIQLFGGIPEKYRKLLRQSRRRPKREASSLLGRRAGGTRRLAKEHSYSVYSGIPPNIAALLKQYRKKQKRTRREYQ